MYGQYLRAVSNQERVIMARVRYIPFYSKVLFPSVQKANTLQNILLQNCLNNMYSFSKKITGLTCSRHFLKYSFWWCHVAFFMEWCFYQLYLVYLDLNLTLMFKTIQVQVWNLHQVPQHRLSKHGMKKIKSDNCDKICDNIENICKSMHIK